MIIHSYLLIIILCLSCVQEKTFTQVKLEHPSAYQQLFDQRGKLLHETRINFKQNRTSWFPLSQVPEEIVDEIVLLEDKRFFSHYGFDPLAFLNALRAYPRRGASTITMQVVGKLYPQEHRSLNGKFTQIMRAMALERSWSKKQILESYLNLISFKGELEGIEAASLSFYGKTLPALNFSQRLLLHAQLPGPNQSSSQILSRACRYLQRLKKHSGCQLLQETLNLAYFNSPKTELKAGHTPHVATQFRKSPAEKITITIDLAAQLEASRLLKGHIRELKHQNVSDGAVLVVERSTGKIIVYVGSSGEFSRASQVDHIRALRQAGSTLKPFLFAQAISRKLITMSTLLKDEPFTVTREGLTYQPENFQKSFTYQEVPAKIALGSSLNIPAVRVIDLLGPDQFHQLLQELEFRNLSSADYYGHSMALGAVDISLWDLVRGYMTLANNGEFRELSFTPQASPVKKRISTFTPEVSFILSHILSEKNNRHMTFGLQSTLSTDSWSAVKTGTSKDMRDNWCVGYTDRYVIGVWVGNSNGESMWNVTGISGAAPIFSRMVSFLHQQKTGQGPIPPEKIVSQGQDYYLAGTEPLSNNLLLTKKELKKILFPQNGAQFAFDPEIPERNQRIVFQSTRPGVQWKINGRELKSHEIDQGFLPARQGKYQLEMWEDESKWDEVSFYVKAGRYDKIKK